MSDYDDKLYGGLYFNEDRTMICLNVASDFPMDKEEFFAYLLDFVRENQDRSLKDIGLELDMEFKEDAGYLN